MVARPSPAVSTPGTGVVPGGIQGNQNPVVLGKAGGVGPSGEKEYAKGKKGGFVHAYIFSRAIEPRPLERLMTPNERVRAALNFEEPDIVAVAERQVDHPIVEHVLGRETFYGGKLKEMQALWRGERDRVVESYKVDYVEFVREVGFDIAIVKLVPPKGYREKPPERNGENVYRYEDGSVQAVSATGYMISPGRTLGPYAGDIEALTYERVDRPDDSCFEMADYVVEELGDTHYVVALAEDVGWPIFGRTDAEAFANMIKRPDLAEKLAGYEGRHAIDSIEWWAKRGVDAIFPSSDYSYNRGPMFPARLFRRLILPWIRRYCERAHELGLSVFKHACGNNWLLMDMFVEAGYDLYQSIQGSAGMDIAELKERYGDKIALMGGIQTDNLVGGTVEDVLRDARYALGNAAPGGGFIYGSSHSIAVGTKVENFEAALGAARRMGKYPLMAD
jgi:hypothetical protein